MRVTTLLSGGLDSAVLLAALLEAEHHVRALYVLPVADGAGPLAERAAAERLAEYFNVELIRGELAAGALEPHSLAGQTALVGIAAALALDHDDEAVAWAAHGGATAPQVQLSHVLRIALKLVNPQLDLVVPFLDHPKAGLVTIGATLGVPFEKTYSCEVGERTHCGACASCRERRAAFVAADVSDPTAYVVEPEPDPEPDEEAA